MIGLNQNMPRLEEWPRFPAFSFPSWVLLESRELLLGLIAILEKLSQVCRKPSLVGFVGLVTVATTLEALCNVRFIEFYY